MKKDGFTFEMVLVQPAHDLIVMILVLSLGSLLDLLAFSPLLVYTIFNFTHLSDAHICLFDVSMKVKGLELTLSGLKYLHTGFEKLFAFAYAGF